MATIEEIEQEADYAAGDPWTPSDANMVPVFSSAFCDVALSVHKDDGDHAYDTNVAHVYALVTYSGGTYTITAGSGVNTGTSKITQNATGNLTIVFNVSFATSDAFGCDIGPGPMDELVFGFQDLTGTNDVDTVTIQLIDNSGTKVDKSFGLALYGVRSA